MSEQTKVLVVKVTAHGDPQYGTGYKHGVGFDGIKGFFSLSPDLQKSMAAEEKMWPPEKGKLLKVELHTKPYTTKQGKPSFYRDIQKVRPATDADPAPEGWDYGDGLPSSTPKPATGTAPQRSRDTDTNSSIQRQFVVKAEAEVLAAAHAADAVSPAVADLWRDWRRHCAELWGEPQAAGKPLVTGVSENDTMDDPSLADLESNPVPF